MMNAMFAAPSLEDVIVLLKAWRFWLLSAFLGIALGAAWYFLSPPPLQARATVLVDFNLEQAWPQDTDRQQFFYLERESRKLEDIAWSDDVLDQVSSATDISIAQLRAGTLRLSQPAEGGWHFYAIDANAQQAEVLASNWAKAFADSVTAQVAQARDLNAFIQVQATETQGLPARPAVPLSRYLLAGCLLGLFLSALGVLFVQPLRRSAFARGDSIS